MGMGVGGEGVVEGDAGFYVHLGGGVGGWGGKAVRMVKGGLDGLVVESHRRGIRLAKGTVVW